MIRDVLRELKNFELGDFIQVNWFDASEDTAPLKEHKKPEWLTSEFGVYLGVEGHPKHILIGKFYSHRDQKWRAARIPLSLIVPPIFLISRKAADESLLRRYTVERDTQTRLFVFVPNKIQTKAIEPQRR